MNQLINTKVILASSRANIFYLSKCRVMVKDGVVVYLTENRVEKQYWNIPVANTTVLLLGTGTSITQSAVRILATAGVMIGFSGEGGTPLIASNEIEWLSPQSEYRPTEYVQGWMSFWFDEARRLVCAKELQYARMKFLKLVWENDRNFKDNGFYCDDHSIKSMLEKAHKEVNQASDVNNLLLSEANFTKGLYRIAAQKTNCKNFVRECEGTDDANSFLNHGNYLAYGLAATTLWVLGIPHGFAVMHGKTRRGALVFDVADLIKDAIILPLAFISSKTKLSSQQFREECIQYFIKHNALDYMFETVKSIVEKGRNL